MKINLKKKYWEFFKYRILIGILQLSKEVREELFDTFVNLVSKKLIFTKKIDFYEYFYTRIFIIKETLCIY